MSACAQQPPLIQPGAPGQESRTLEGREAARVADNRYSDTDVAFMQGMIHHHGQAVEMAVLVQGRTATPALVELAGRINASQADEIAFMQGWLRERGEDAPAPAPTAADRHAGHAAAGHAAPGHAVSAHGAGHGGMAGMATAAQLTQLKASSGSEFDRQFLQLMIAHHEGAITMVTSLLAEPGSAYDPVLYRFATDVTNEQQAEIKRMAALLRGLAARLAHSSRADLPTTHPPRDCGGRPPRADFAHCGTLSLSTLCVALIPRPLRPLHLCQRTCTYFAATFFRRSVHSFCRFSLVCGLS